MNTDLIVPNTEEIIASQQATISRLIEFREAQGLEIVALKAQLAAAHKQNDAARAEAIKLKEAGKALVEKLSLLLDTIDAHECTCFSCDRDGETYCDCLKQNAKLAADALARAKEAGFAP